MKKSTLITITFILFSILLASCYNPIFYEIRKDVKPEDATVSGTINAITRYTAGGKEFLVLAADKGLRYKLADNAKHGSWAVYENLPFEMHSYDFFKKIHKGQQLLKILADSEYIYLVSATFKDDASEGKTILDRINVYAKKIALESDSVWKIDSKDGNGWKNVISDADGTYFPKYTSGDYQYTAFAIFQTNAPKKEHRHVFIRKGSTESKSSSFKDVKYYELKMGNAPVEYTVSKVEDSDKSNAQSAIFFGGNILFFNSPASTTNESYGNEATFAYYGNGKTLYYSVGGAFTESPAKVNQLISALATCKDSILIGCADFESTNSSASGGIFRAPLAEGIPAAVAPFETNANFQITTTFFVPAILNATPDKTERDSILYATTSLFGSKASNIGNAQNVGLWSCYPERGNWNRE